MAHVEKRGPQRWRARYRGPDGRERSRTFERRVDADRWLVAQEADKARGVWIDPALGRVTFGQWAERWLELQGQLRPKTAAGYAGILRGHLLPRFGTHGLAAIQPLDVAGFVADLRAAGAAPRTVRNVYRVLSAIMRAAVVNRRIAQSPCVGISLPSAPKQEMLCLSAGEVARLADSIGEGYGPLILFAAYTGLRFGEIAALRAGRVSTRWATVHVVESLSEVGGEVLFVPPKNGRTRTVSLPGALVEQLAPLVDGRPAKALVFTAPDGGPLRHSRFMAKVFRPAVTRAGLDRRLRFHDLRHTCAALLIAQGAHPRAIMERLGHSSITVTMDTYGHLLPSVDEALTAGLEATFRAASHVPAASLRPGDGQLARLPG